MSKEYNLISDFDYRIIAAFFAGLDRQGPGDDAQTRRALSFIDGLPPRPRIADIGCGTGRQTAVLASALGACPILPGPNNPWHNSPEWLWESSDPVFPLW